MTRKFKELGETLDEFVSQVDYPALVIEGGAGDVAYLTMQLQALEQTHSEAWALVFSTPFSSAGQYVDSSVELLRHQLDATAPFRLERGESPLAPLPAEVLDRSRPPNERLRAVLDYLRSLLPNQEDHVVAIGLLPAECSNFAAYAALVASILPVPTIEPWMRALRIVAYDDRTEPVLRALLDTAKSDTVLTYSVDFSVPALTDGLVRSTADASLAVSDRMASLLQLAMLDHAHKRYVPALEKLGVLHDYYEQQRMPELQAMCLHGAGDVLLAAGQPGAAKRMLQRGLAVAMEHKVLPVLLNLSLSIVDTCMQLAQYAEAETYADSGMVVAARTLNPYSYADMDEKKGDAQFAQGKVARALSTYQHCVEASRNNGYFSRCKSALRKRARIYAEAGMKDQQRETEVELLVVEDRERKGDRVPRAKPEPIDRDPSRSRKAASPSLGAAS